MSIYQAKLTVAQNMDAYISKNGIENPVFFENNDMHNQLNNELVQIAPPVMKTLNHMANERFLRQIDADQDDDLPIGQVEHLPHGLGKIQEFIYHGMIYPSKGNAGFAAMSFLQSVSSAIFVGNIGQGDFALNEMYLQFGPTSSGKECVRSAIRKLYLTCTDKINSTVKPKMFMSLAASQQGLHDELVDANGVGYYLADEFGEWLADTKREGPRQQCVAYLMQAYTSPFSKISVPASSARKDKQNELEFPRINIFATSTWSRMSDVMQASQANSGSYNRFFMNVGESAYIQKRYDITPLEPSDEIKSLLAWIGSNQSGTRISFSEEARKHYSQFDSDVVEPIKFKEPALAGRLSLQAIRLAATIAISDKRLVVEKSDLVSAYEIRMQAYYRFASAIKRDGLLSERSNDAEAVEQLTKLFKRKYQVSRTDLKRFSRNYTRLAVYQQQQVVKMLLDNGVCCESPVQKGSLLSMIFNN
jgi:hypothetical protein